MTEDDKKTDTEAPDLSADTVAASNGATKGDHPDFIQPPSDMTEAVSEAVLSDMVADLEPNTPSGAIEELEDPVAVSPEPAPFEQALIEALAEYGPVAVAAACSHYFEQLNDAFTKAKPLRTIADPEGKVGAIVLNAIRLDLSMQQHRVEQAVFAGMAKLMVHSTSSMFEPE